MRQMNKESSVIMKLKTTEYLGENRAEIGCCREKIRLLIQKNMLTILIWIAHFSFLEAS